MRLLAALHIWPINFFSPSYMDNQFFYFFRHHLIEIYFVCDDRIEELYLNRPIPDRPALMHEVPRSKPP